jgi:hypothetical protein
VVVAVLADGVVTSQPDLTGSVVAGPDFTHSGRAARDPHFGVIGTGLASLIAGHGNGQKSASGGYADGILGIARHAKILSVRVTLSPGDPLWSSTKVTSRLPADLAAGIRYAVEHGASVIALPADPAMPGIAGWGGVAAVTGGSAGEQAAVAFAVRHNVVLVAPAGDNGQAGDAPDYPAAYQGVAAVGAFGRNFVKAPSSSHRGYVAFTAAGSGVAAAAPTGYQTMNGTWAASAIAAGVAALVRSQFPNLTAVQVLTTMTAGTVHKPPGGVLDGSGHGTLDAQQAIRQAAAMSPPHAAPASLGALPRRQPAVPPVRSSASIIEGGLLQDGLIAAAALAALLIPITWYGSVARRRSRFAAEAVTAAERGRRSAVRADQGMLADPPLAFFGPQHARPASQQEERRGEVSTRFQPRPGLTGRSTLSAAFAARPMLPAPPAATVDTWLDDGSSRLTGAPALAGPVEPPRATAPRAWRGQSGAAQRGESAGRPDAWTGGDAGFSPPGPAASTLRHAPVSGSPPWEPAQRPTSELPWATVPGRQAAGGRSTGTPAPVTGRPAGPGGASVTGRLGPPDQSREAADDGADRAPWAGSGQRSADSGSHPIYIWNPAAPDSTGQG